MKSFISLFDIINVVTSDPKICLCILAASAYAAAVSCNGINTLLVNGLSTFFINGKPVVRNW